MKNALILFVNNPELGAVKTELAASIGDDKALEIHLNLLEHTANVAKEISVDRFVFFKTEIPENDEIFDTEHFVYHLQDGINTASKLKDAFELLFEMGYSNVLLSYCDSFEIQPEIIEQAFQELKDTPLLLGPTRKDNVYLLGMNTHYEFLFDKIDWDDGNVFTQLVNQLMDGELPWFELPILNTIENEEDLKLSETKEFYRKILANQ